MFMKKILFSVFIICAFKLNAQIVITEEADTETLIISDGDKTSKGGRKVSDNIWKVDVIGPVYGKYGVSYERELLSFLAIQATVGMTYYNFSDYYLSLFSFNKSVPLAPGKNLYVGDYRKQNILNAKPGFYFNAMPKIYVRGDGFEGFYLGLGLNYNKWSYKKTKREVDYNAIDNKQLGGEFALGYQVINGKMAVDVSTSFGANRNSTSLSDQVQEYNAQYVTFYYGISLKLGRYF